MGRDERRATKRTTTLIELDPSIQAAAMEHMPAITEPPYFRRAFKIVQAHSAALCAGVSRMVPEIIKVEDRERFLDKKSGEGGEEEGWGLGLGLVNGVEEKEVGEADGVEEGDEETTDEGEKEGQGNEEAREEHR